MNRHDRRAQRKQQIDHVAKFPKELTPWPIDQWPSAAQNMGRTPEKLWLSRDYLVELWRENNPCYPGLLRLSICRTRLEMTGRWQDGLTWDELQTIKRAVGYGDWQAIELYPPDDQVEVYRLVVPERKLLHDPERYDETDDDINF